MPDSKSIWLMVGISLAAAVVTVVASELAIKPLLRKDGDNNPSNQGA